MYHRSHDRPVGRAPDYTAACLVMFGANLIWMLFALLAAFGLAAVVLAGLTLNTWISWLAARRR